MSLQSMRISRKAYELPLLKSLIECGGFSVPQDKLYRLVAEKMGFKDREMEYDPAHAKPKWVYDLQWVRHALVKRGDIDGSQRGVWKITEKGRERLRLEWGSYNMSDYFTEEASLGKKVAVAEELLENDIAEEVTNDLAERFVPESLDVIKGQILIDDTPINQVITIINANRHLMLTGPPGTGKTTIAINAAEQAVKANFISGYLLTTATSDWTTFDTVGGYMPQPGRELVFTPGVVLRSINENKWLLIDEINRADVDKAFGQLLTTLSGQEVELPFTDEIGKSIRIRRAKGLRSYYDEQAATYFVGDNWRIIGTMNTFDKNSLFSFSYALTRRFGFIHINNPSRSQLHSIIDGRNEDGHLSGPDAQKVKRLLDITPREFGPAILIDILNYLRERNSSEAFFESVVAYVLPQFEGLPVEAMTEFFRKAASDLGNAESQAQMKRYLAQMFEIEPVAWDAI